MRLTVAFSVARLTDTLPTPGSFASAFSTRMAHEAHVIPLISSSALACATRSGVERSVMVILARGGVRPHHDSTIHLPMMGRSRTHAAQDEIAEMRGEIRPPRALTGAAAASRIG